MSQVLNGELRKWPFIAKYKQLIVNYKRFVVKYKSFSVFGSYKPLIVINKCVNFIEHAPAGGSSLVIFILSEIIFSFLVVAVVIAVAAIVVKLSMPSSAVKLSMASSKLSSRLYRSSFLFMAVSFSLHLFSSSRWEDFANLFLSETDKTVTYEEECSSSSSQVV